MRAHRHAGPIQTSPSTRRVRRLLVAAALLATTLATGRTAQAAVGPITQFRVSGTCICQGIASGADGALWFTRTDASANLSWVGHITTARQVTQYAIPAPGGGLGAITQGSDGAMWFAESSGYIGRVTTS